MALRKGSQTALRPTLRGLTPPSSVQANTGDSTEHLPPPGPGESDVASHGKGLQGLRSQEPRVRGRPGQLEASEDWAGGQPSTEPGPARGQPRSPPRAHAKKGAWTQRPICYPLLLLAKKQKPQEASRKQSKLQEMKKLETAARHGKSSGRGAAASCPAPPRPALPGHLSKLRAPGSHAGFQVRQCERDERPVMGRHLLYAVPQSRARGQHPTG